ncbi:hypothetical protein C7974DRAFT_68531 [Boeremia exigua]|uniref:uncharacterized protein n=1 Tax=Boeremia exigua TaxID=749465 RepID=UPI001E8E35F6|nr:uncharacterized protein C7974DRAFT_68531 [Boeremia exigua]KAH6614010.1 hypothetical protein C7974DRAFT_68531 [Boeremia exigua]
MTSRGLQSAYSSRDVSPNRRAEPYDPFHDQIEMSHLPEPSLNAHNSHSSREQSLEDEQRGRSHGRSHSGAYLLPTQNSSQYAPLNSRQESPRPSMRSGRESMISVASLYQAKTMDADTQALVEKRVGELAQWHVHWTTPAIISSLFVAGVMGALGHHFFYAHLNGKPATEQLMMVRYGTALAFFTKSMLVSCVVVCYRQRVWHTLRRKAMTINGIDGLFSATEDPTMFFLNWEMVRNGKLATLMAICSWLIPIASVLSPASLTSQPRPTNMTMICPTVATLNLTREAVFNFREEQHGNSRGNSLVYYNTTDPSGMQDGYFDYYDGPSKIARRLAFSSAYLKKAQPREKAAAEFCGTGWNCTYSINFMAPGYKCDDVSTAIPWDAPFTLDQIAPQGDFIYHAEVDQGEYKRPQAPTTEGVPDPGYPESLGVFEDEPVLWIGYTENTSTKYPADSPYAQKWVWVHEPKIFKCVMYHTNYTFEMRYRPTQNATLKERHFLYPVINTTLRQNSSNDTTFTASPTSAFISPRDDPTAYKLTATYHSMGAMFRTFIRGDIEKTSDTFIITRSDISETRLMDGRTSYPQRNLMAAVQSLFEDMLLTLLSEPTLVAAETQAVECVKSRLMIVYIYLPRSLWIGYAMAVAVTLASILIGSWAIYQNGVASDTLFSRILVTTRNPTLDHLSVGACLGGDPFPKELRETKLRFGVLLEDEPREGPLGRVEHCCFGTRGETSNIVKGNNYAGLKRYRGEQGSREEKRGLLEDDRNSL